jgi:hypothetical protein
MAYTQCKFCIDEVSDTLEDLDLYVRLSAGGENPTEEGEYYHPYYADIWCRNDKGTRAAPGRVHE